MGQRLKITFSTYDCTQGAHYGYAYFTLTCTSGKLKGLQCGWTPTNEFIAPEGFNYRWYRTEMPSETLGRDQVYKVDYRDIRDYAVDITYKSDPTCGFTLYANAIPRFPIPEATYTLEQRDCGNYISFTNTSHIRTRNWTTGEEIDTQIVPEYFGWSFDGLKPSYDNPWSPSFRLPDEEADYHFMLMAGVGLCDSIKHIYVHVPRVGPDSIVEKVQLCEGDIYRHNGKYYQADEVIIDHDYNTAGCDSTHVIDLRFVDAIRDTIEATIPEGSSYTVGTQSFSTSGEYTITMPSVAGCDSIVTLKLEVVVPLEMQIASIEYPCPNATSFHIETHAVKGIPNYYKLQFGKAGYSLGFIPQADSLKGGADNSIEVMMPAGVRPGYYPFAIHFSSAKNGEADVEGELMIEMWIDFPTRRLRFKCSPHDALGWESRRFDSWRLDVALSRSELRWIAERIRLAEIETWEFAGNKHSASAVDKATYYVRAKTANGYLERFVVGYEPAGFDHLREVLRFAATHAECRYEKGERTSEASWELPYGR